MTSQATIRGLRNARSACLDLQYDEQDALLRQAEAGRTLAFERIVWRYDESILGLFLHLTRSEQDAIALYRATFLKAYRRLAGREEPSLYIWLHRNGSSPALARTTARFPSVNPSSIRSRPARTWRSRPWRGYWRSPR